MKEVAQKMGPVEKTKNGWPINPLGVAVLVIFIIITAFLIAKPMISQRFPSKAAVMAQIASPQAGQIVKGDKLSIELSVSDASKVEKVQFWAKTYVENKWEPIGEATSWPYKIEWQVPASYQNKAIVLTSHIYLKDSKIIKDSGGWREGIIILSQ
ncbi:MAG: Ig-like domain-containing protein [Candidatus Curtissbacteria bacterium]